VSSERDVLLAHIRSKAIVHEQVVLSSGATADYYIDLRRVTLSGAAAPLVGRLMLELTSDLGYEAVGGPALAAVPLADAILHAAAANGRELDSFIVRGEAKKHGLQRLIEGPDVKGRRVLAVEDTSTTGGSVLQAVDALHAAGAEVVAVAAIVDRDTSARANIEAAGLEYRYLYGLNDLGLA
jgi:orotate phosphoribosyltransferase